MKMFNRVVLMPFLIFSFSQTIFAADPSSQMLYIGALDFFGAFAAAGYSDWIFYGQNPIHSYDYHELLSGEWGAAIHYDGQDTGTKAVWLTDKFLFPNWPTNSNFQIHTFNASYDDPNNPVPANNLAYYYGYYYGVSIANDTARTIIENDKVKVTIDYEVVDLGDKRSPMSFNLPDKSDPNNMANWVGCYMLSDRYVFLQTYTITNIDPNNTTLENLEFYQMLHSHGADEYGPAVNSTYEAFPYDDPLEDYVPFNSVHKVGNFRYDITQWNMPEHEDSIGNGMGGGGDHADWMSFSSTVEPNWIDTGYYEGHGDEPSYGTHKHIENRNLNEKTGLFGEEVAGAMGWFLGNLAPGQSVSHTVAVMFGHGPVVTEAIDFHKSFSLGANSCASYDQEFNYFVVYGAEPNDLDNLGYITDAKIVDHLPAQVDFVSAAGGVHDPCEHTVTWTLDPNDLEGLHWFTLTVSVNESFIPGSEIENYAKMTLTNAHGQEYYNEDTAYTQLCDCSEYGDIIYVDTDKNLQDPNGADWNHAYKKLEDALAAASPCDEIWVAEGTYTPPATDPNIVFNVPSAVGLYGGFKGTEDYRYLREWATNKTILSADTKQNDTGDPNYYTDNADHVLIVDSNSVAVIDGFFISDAVTAGIYSQNSLTAILHNTITDNKYAIFCKNIYESIIRNNLIYDNDYGIHLEFSCDTALIQNNTITDNSDTGLYYDSGILPDVVNCIIWGNTKQLSWDYTNPDLTVTYSCIQDSNDTTPTSPYYNINTDPCFVNAAGDDYHLDPNSPCIDAGDPDRNYKDQRDIDDHFRVFDGDDNGIPQVDIGADEYIDPDRSLADFNQDNFVNYIDFALFSTAWLQGPNDPNWNSGKYDLDADNQLVDTDDLLVLADEWLWVADVSQPQLPPEPILMLSGMYAPQSPLSIEDQIERAENNLNWLNKLWKTDKEVRDTIDQDRWEDFIESIEAWIDELEDSL